MNYAEDRLDRRARSAHSPESEAGKKGDTPTQDQLARDLKRAYDVIISYHSRSDSDARPRSDDDDISLHRDLRAAHELAGKTLRDGGQNRQAVFHFGMAWRICHWLEKRNNNSFCRDTSSCTPGAKDEAENEWRSVGDYAQICELAGFPEIGALSLLFYRAGGNLDVESIALSSSTNGVSQQDYGCDLAECGTSPCFIAFPTKSNVVDDILQALDSLQLGPNDHVPTSSDILSHLAHLARNSSTIRDPVSAMHAFLSEQQSMKEVPSILQFWDDAGHISASKDQQQVGKIEYHVLPPVILLLLLKLLYSSPISGPFLKLSCISMPYLAGKFPPASAEGKLLARHYKSHWAYYVFIRSLVLGERMKKHRRGKGIHHVPVWDVVFGLEMQPQIIGPKKCEEEKKGSGPILEWEATTSNYCSKILHACSSKSIDPIAFPCITQQQISSFSAHPPIFVVGDSHVLSLAWQTLRIDLSKVPRVNGETQNENDQKQSLICRTAFPFPATGMKAWHVRPSSRFFTHYNLHACIQRLPPLWGRSIILSAGEIDCREGIGGSLLQGYYRNCGDAVERTVIEYLTSLTSLAEKYKLQILVMPVAPHAYRSEKNGKSVGRAKRRETMLLWNKILRRELGNGKKETDNPHSKYDRVFLLDYDKRLQHPDRTEFVLHPSYNADYTHVN
eukprot:CAMPEP_0181134214 /NCGR_PEP_ID=MMETSP1071-20121207/31973_1 /TAXON_ID=35127 /ORGANISM="Thalassiosira sp., Strain NH16" /LENGTH=674 /DNA_ID=CAMNT_0023220727 /DNA_START=71 /DNA_END=2092 /DNA_ORIENTATION=-